MLFRYCRRQQSCWGWSRRCSGGPCMCKDLECCLNMLRMNLGPLMFHQTSLFQPFGFQGMSALARFSLLLDALPILSAHLSRFFLLCCVGLTNGIRFPNAHPLPEEIGAICFTDQFAF